MEDLVKITENEYYRQMDKLYMKLPLKEQDFLLMDMESLGNCEASKDVNVNYYFDKKEKEYTYRVERI